MPSSDASKVLIGRDASVYSIAYGGLDLAHTAPSFGASASLLSIWKDIKVTSTRDLYNVSSSSALFKEKRRGIADWKATMSNMVRSTVGSPGGSGFLAFGDQNDYAKILFTEESTGYTIICIGMIASIGTTRNQQEAMQDMEIEGCGYDALVSGDGGLAYYSS